MEDLICYCLGYSRADIEADVTPKGESRIYQRILAEKKANGCDCATKNPKGR